MERCGKFARPWNLKLSDWLMTFTRQGERKM